MDQIHMSGPWVTEHEISVVEDCMRNGWYNYDYVETFEKEFAAYHDRKYAVMTPSCTTAIHLLLAALKIGHGDEVIVPELTWIASAAPLAYVGAEPVFCDVDETSWCIDPESLERAITSRTKAVINVDLFGNMSNMDALLEICDRYGIVLIDDTAEALGSTYKGIRAGKFGVGSVFSFHRTKTVVIGEGGMLLLDDDHLFERAMILRDHGRSETSPPYFPDEVAFKYMPFNLQAAMGYAQFQRIDELVERKRWMYDCYKQKLADIEDLQFNDEPEHVFNSVWITGLVFGKSHNMSKADAISKLSELGIPSRPFFYPMSSLPGYKSHEAENRRLNPKAYDISARGINLPGALITTEEQIDAVCDGIRNILGRG